MGFVIFSGKYVPLPLFLKVVRHVPRFVNLRDHPVCTTDFLTTNFLPTFTRLDTIFVIFADLQAPDAETPSGKPDGAFMVNFKVLLSFALLGVRGADCARRAGEIGAGVWVPGETPEDAGVPGEAPEDTWLSSGVLFTTTEKL
jgi:hypothetical protein